ncbi:MAG: molybdopterin molybdenumtransferase MoeA [Chitinophagaceae bacterium]|nr:molybdopterin molybdenumtransferase MoeA [Chitinophagaceae bacterium]
MISKFTYNLSLTTYHYKMISVQEALSIILDQSRSFGTTTVSINEATGRVLAEDIHADRNYPPFHRAAMDGFALRSIDFLEKGIRTYEIIEELFAGGTSTLKPHEGQSLRIMTGSATPIEYDAIIRIEDCTVNGTQVTFHIDTLKKGQNIARQGEDAKAGELIMAKDTRLFAPEVAALAVTGRATVLVHQQPKVAVISTGDEVISVGKEVKPHQIRDSNSYALASFLHNYGLSITYRTLVPDNKDLLSKAVQDVLEYDIVIFSGGVSMGEADFVPGILVDCGVQNLFHKVKLKPGKPLWFGKLPSGGVVFGLPGNPMSCQVCYKIFIEPFLRQCLGLGKALTLQLPLVVNKKKNVKLDQYFPCVLEGGGIKPVVINGSGDITSTLHSHGLAVHPLEVDDLVKGDTVDFIFW